MTEMHMTGHSWGGSPIHPVIDHPHQFSIVRFDYHVDSEEWRNNFLDLISTPKR